jgi:class 3 adenylate cyclase/tetratricopeptide (TPR) repeat protein
LNCPSCGHRNRPEARFCEGCGAPLGIRISHRVLEGERKLVTVLFADLVGSMEIAERRDPEESLRMMSGLFTILCDGVQRFEGTVDKFTGDGIMALFGAPIAHEDHAQRACYAALELQRQLRARAGRLGGDDGRELALRIGIHSGEVVIGTIGDGVAVEFTAFGHAVGLARRAEALAANGTVCATRDTVRLAEGFLSFRDLGEFDVRGASRPLHLYELTGRGHARGRLDVSRAHGFSRFVGRAREMGEIQNALDRAIERDALVVGVVGETGVGKSRLSDELARRADERGVRVVHVAARAHAKSVALLPVLELIRAYFGVSATDPPSVTRDRIERELRGLDGGFAEDLPLIFDLLGVPDDDREIPRVDPEAWQTRAFAATTRAIREHSLRRPGVTVIEDLQWLDPASQAFLAAYVETIERGRGLIVVDFRPGYEADWMSLPHYAEIELQPLEREAADEMIADLLGRDPSVRDLARVVRGRTGGNPFFIEEVVQSLADVGDLEGERGTYRLARAGGPTAVPPNVRAAVAARIDRLGPPEKSVLHAASVLAEDFPRSLLARIPELADLELDDALGSLVSAQFLSTRESHPEAAYSFRHPLTQEVAYGSLLSDRRTALHAACARAISEQWVDRRDERAAVIARHWEAAQEWLEAARWRSRAAAWSGKRDPRDSMAHWQIVRELTDRLSGSEEAQRLGLAARSLGLQFGWRLGISPERARALFEEAERMAVQAGDVHTRTVVVAMYGLIRGSNHGDLADYVALVRQGLALADSSGDIQLQQAIATGASWALFNVGQLREAVEVADRALAVVTGESSPGSGTLLAESHHAQAMIFKGGYLLHLGELNRGGELVSRGIAAALEQGDVEIAGRGHVWFSFFCFFAGVPDGALDHAHQGLQIAEQIGDSLSLSIAWYGLAMAEQMRGAWAEAIVAVDRSVLIARQHATSAEMDPWRLWVQAESHLGLGDPIRAQRIAEEGLALTRSRGQPAPQALLGIALARSLLGLARPELLDDAEQSLAQALELAENCGARSIVPLAYVELAELARARGDGGAHHEALLAAHRLFAEIGASGHAERTMAKLVSVP